jgi:hypothetical protein
MVASFFKINIPNNQPKDNQPSIPEIDRSQVYIIAQTQNSVDDAIRNLNTIADDLYYQRPVNQDAVSNAVYHLRQIANGLQSDTNSNLSQDDKKYYRETFNTMVEELNNHPSFPKYEMIEANISALEGLKEKLTDSTFN